MFRNQQGINMLNLMLVITVFAFIASIIINAVLDPNLTFKKEKNDEISWRVEENQRNEFDNNINNDKSE